MKNKLIKYLILDSFLVLLFLLLFDKMAINTTFHEIAGLVMLCTCLLHVALHPSYVINVTKKR